MQGLPRSSSIGVVLLCILASTPHGFSNMRTYSAAKIVLSPPDSVSRVNDNLAISVLLENSPRFIGFWITIQYDTLVLDALTANIALPWGGSYVKLDRDLGTVDLSSVNTQQPLEGNFLLATIEFHSKANGNSTLEIKDTELLDAEINPIPHVTQNGRIEVVGPLSITIKDLPDVFYIDQNATICGNATVEETSANALIGIEIRSQGILLSTRVVTSGVVPYESLSSIRIGRFFPSDENGSFVDTVRAGNQIYFTTYVHNPADVTAPILVVINLYDRYNRPLGFTLLQSILYPNASLMYIAPINVDLDASNGTAIAYVNLFSDWPHNRGIPYDVEQSAVIQITDGLGGKLLPDLPTGGSCLANYNLTFRPPANQGIGNYSVYVTAHYKVQDAYAEATSPVELLGDFNHDGKVGPYEFARISKAYGSTPISPRWLPEADFDKNVQIGPGDFAVFAILYGRHV